MFTIPIPTVCHSATGSSVICPEIGPNDDDVVALVLSIERAVKALSSGGWTVETDLTYNGESVTFVSARQGKNNLIITESHELYTSFVRATILARAMHLTAKKDRILLFQFVLYGKLPKTDLIMWPPKR